ncbi:hypothetical protein DFJ74DRAFT_645508 [Hyaloraphidium curvatum]|nr:hypothetical protein DFJ74DRAFT_645508 [Hyaloraphidium curvatum]
MELLRSYGSSSDDEDASSAEHAARRKRRRTEDVTPRTEDKRRVLFDSRPATPAYREYILGLYPAELSPSFVFVPVPRGSRPHDLLEEMFEFAKQSDDRIRAVGGEEATASSKGLHISLTRTAFLRSFQWDGFLRMVEDKMKRVKRSGFLSVWRRSAATPPPFSFNVGFSDPGRYVSETGERTFLSANIGPGSAQLTGLVKAMDDILEHFRQPKYYEEPRFHVSFAFLDCGDQDLDRGLLERLRDRFRDDLASCTFPIDSDVLEVDREPIALLFGAALIQHTNREKWTQAWQC